MAEAVMLRIIFLLIFMGVISVGGVLAGVDYQCMNYCKNSGYDNSLCKDYCTTYNDNNANRRQLENNYIQSQEQTRQYSRVDFMCMKDCVKKRQEFYETGIRLEGELSTSEYCRRKCAY
jgi:hypothetical protein